MSHRGEGSRTKKKSPAKKRQRTDDILDSILSLRDDEPKRRYAALKNKPFDSIRYIDWATLRQLGIENEVHELVSFGGWDRLFSFQAPAYRELTIAVLSTFEMYEKGMRMHEDDAISFKVNGRSHRMSYARLAVRLGIYTEEFVASPAYATLALDFPRGFDAAAYWYSLTHQANYHPSKAKSTQLESPALRYVHRLISCTLHARRDSPGVVGVHDLLCLYSMRERYPINLGYFVAEFIWQQGFRGKNAALYAGHYITRLFHAMNAFDALPRMVAVREVEPLDMTSLLRMRLAEKRQGPDGFFYVLKGAPEEVPGGVGGGPLAVAEPGDNHPEEQEQEQEPEQGQDQGPEIPVPEQQVPPVFSQGTLDRILALQNQIVATQTDHGARLTSLERYMGRLFDHFHIAPPSPDGPHAQPPTPPHPADDADI